MNIYLPIVILLMSGATLMGGDESLKRLEENRVCLFADPYGVSVMIERVREKVYKVEAKINGVTIQVPQKELSGFKLLQLRSASLSAYYDQAGNISKDKPLRSFVVGMKYGGTSEHGSEKAPVVVFSYLKLYFDNGKFTGWRSAEPEGEFKNKWIIRDKDVDGKIETSDPVEKIDCPIIPQGVY